VLNDIAWELMHCGNAKRAITDRAGIETVGITSSAGGDVEQHRRQRPSIDQAPVRELPIQNYATTLRHLLAFSRVS
jgi:hypothetical protein